MEFWDLYDAERRPLHRTRARGSRLRRGEYHVVVFVWIFDGNGKTLLTKRSPEKKSYPNYWEATGGAVQAGETSLQAITRELREETGIVAEPSEFRLVSSVCESKHNSFCDVYLLQKSVPLSEITFQIGETCDARWVNREELERIIAGGRLSTPDVRRYRELAEEFKKYLW